MNLGISFTARDLYQPSSASKRWQEALIGYPDPSDLPAELGINTIELKTFSPDNDILDEVLGPLVEKGYEITFHRDIVLPGHWRAGFNDYEHFNSICTRHGISEPLVVIHGTHGNNLYPLEHRQATAETVDLLTSAFPNMRISIEVSRKRERHMQACEDYDSTLKVARRFNSSRTGICWDMGHGLANAIHCQTHFIPEKAFLERVNNVHVHDLKGGESHHFLQPDSLPIEKAIDALIGVGYQGNLIIEVLPCRINEGEAFVPHLRNMATRIQDILLTRGLLTSHGIGA